MARIPTGSSFIADHDRWQMDKVVCRTFEKLSGADFSRELIEIIEKVVNSYLHDRARFEAGADMSEVTDHIKKFRKALETLSRFLDGPFDESLPRSLDAACCLVSKHYRVENADEYPGPKLQSLLKQFDEAASQALTEKGSRASDPSSERFDMALMDELEDAGVQISVRGHQGGGVGADAERWSEYTEFAFVLKSSIADHCSIDRPKRNSGFPAALSRANAARKKRKQNAP